MYLFGTFGEKDIAQLLDETFRLSVKHHNEKVKSNRYILSRIIECIKFCGAFELALRGHDEKEDSINPGIFKGLVDFTASLDSAMQQHLSSATVFKGTSKTIQNELLECIYTVCLNHIKNEVKSARFISIICDETTDVSNRIQCVFVIRYLHFEDVKECFICFSSISTPNAEGITNIIMKCLNNVIEPNDTEKLISQSYDGAAVMKGAHNGVQKLVRDKFPFAHYVHCYAHQLNLVMSNASSTLVKVRIFFANLSAFSSFFSLSPKRAAVLESLSSSRLPRPSATRWNLRSRLVSTVLENRQKLIQCFTVIIESADFDDNSIHSAIGLKRLLSDEEFLFYLYFFNNVMMNVDILSAQLQKRDCDSLSARDNIQHFCRAIETTKNKIDEVWAKLHE